MGEHELADRANLVCVEGLSDSSVLCALANISSERTPAIAASTNCPRGSQAEFTDMDLERRVGCAKRALPGRYFLPSAGSFDQQLRTNAQFLADIGLPLRFVETADSGRCIDASAFDERHWPGAAQQAVEYLRRTGSSDTRSLREPSAVVSQGRSRLLAEPQVEAVHCRFEHDLCVYRCRSLRTQELLGLLCSLWRARQSGAPYSLEKLESIIPRSAYQLVPYESRIIGAEEPSAQMIADALSAETGLQIDTFGEELRIRGIDQAFAGELSFVVGLWCRRQERLRSLVLLTLGSMVFLCSVLILLSAFLDWRLFRLSYVELGGVSLLGITTSWMPLKLLRMITA